MAAPAQYVVVMTSVASEPDADRLATILVEKQLAACVQMLPIRSVYRWQGKLCKEQEILLLIKTASEKYEPLEACIRSNHPYEVPEVVAVPIADGSVGYLQWIDSSLKQH